MNNELDTLLENEGKHIDITEEQIKNALTKEDKIAFSILQALNPSFVQKLQNKIFNYADITAQDIIEIVYSDNIANNEEVYYVSTKRICDYIGIRLICENKEDGKLEGTIGFLDDELVITYCNHSHKYKRRFTRAHELGHLFKQLILGLRESFEDKKNTACHNDTTPSSSANNKDYDRIDVLAKLSFEDTNIDKKHIEYEDEANSFARDLLLPKDTINLLENLEIITSEGKICDTFKVSYHTLNEKIDLSKYPNIVKDNIQMKF